MNFLVNNENLLKAHNAIWNNISNLLEKGFDSKPLHDNKCIRTKSYNGKRNTNSQGDKILEEGVCCTCFSSILLDSAVKVCTKYYPQVFLEAFILYILYIYIYLCVCVCVCVCVYIFSQCVINS